MTRSECLRSLDAMRHSLGLVADRSPDFRMATWSTAVALIVLSEIEQFLESEGAPHGTVLDLQAVAHEGRVSAADLLVAVEALHARVEAIA